MPQSHSPIILALDTSGALTGVALLAHGQLHEATLSGGPEASRHLLPLITELVAGVGIALADLTAIAYGAGPGAFTGIRTSAAVALGLGFACDREVIPVCTLEAMAFAADRQGRVASVIDARMGEVYVAVHELTPEGGRPRCLVPPFVAAPQVACNALIAALPEGWDDACVVGAHHLLPGLPPGAHAASGEPLTAAAVARLGACVYRAGGDFRAELAQPVYVRNKVAQTLAERAAV